MERFSRVYVENLHSGLEPEHETGYFTTQHLIITIDNICMTPILK